MITVEELQILLQCDATQAEQVLSDIESRVNDFVKKVEDAFKRTSGKNSNPLDGVSSDGVDSAIKSVNSLSEALATATGKAKELSTALKLSGISGAKPSKQLDELGKSLDEIGEKAQKVEEIPSTVTGGTVTVEYDVSTNGKSLDEALAGEYQNRSLGGGTPALTPPDLEKPIDLLDDRMKQTIELAGSVRAKMEDAATSAGKVGVPDVLANSVQVVDRNISLLSEKLRTLGQTEGTSVPVLANTEKQLQASIEKANRLTEKLNDISDRGASPDNMANADSLVKDTFDLAGQAGKQLQEAMAGAFRGAEVSGTAIGDALVNKVKIAERELEILRGKLRETVSSGDDSAQQLSVTKQLQTAIEKAERLKGELEGIAVAEKANENLANMSNTMATTLALAEQVKEKLRFEGAFQSASGDDKVLSNRVALAVQEVERLQTKLRETIAFGGSETEQLAIAKQLQAAIEKADALKAKLQTLNGSENLVEPSLSGSTDVDVLGNIRSKLSAFGDEAKLVLSYVAEKVGSALSTVASGIGSVIGFVGNAISMALSLAVKAIVKLANLAKRAISGIVGVAKSVGNALKKAFDNSIFGKFLNTLKRLKTTMLRTLITRAIRSAISGIKEGFESLAESSESSAEAMNAFKTMSASVKVSLASAVMPVLKALAPLFYAIARAAAAAANAIASFFAAITGQGHYTAVSVKKDMAAVESAAGGGGSAMKGLLADFDELNVIQSDSGGGGGGGSTSWTDTNDETLLPDWAQRIKDSIDAGDWAGAATALTDHLNGLIAGLEWDNLGADFGTKFNNVLTFINTAVKTFKWDDLGTNIASWLNNALAQIDFSAIGSLLMAKFNITLNFLYGFVKEFNFDALADDVISAINGAFRSVDWNKVGKTLNTALKKILSGLSKVVNQIDWATMGLKIGNAIVTAFEGADIGKLLMGVLQAALLLVAGLLEAFFDASVADVVQVTNYTIAVVEKCADVILIVVEGIAASVLVLVLVILDAISGIFPSVKSTANDIRGTIEDLGGMIEDQADRLAQPIETMVYIDLDKTSFNSAAEAVDYFAHDRQSTVYVNYKEGTVSKSSGGGGTGKSSISSFALPFASGGLVYGETFARIGEYVGARNNPEVVAPLSDLRSILASTNTGNSNGMTREQANTMIGLLQRVADKELTIEPSAELGRVTSQSLTAYGTI